MKRVRDFPLFLKSPFLAVIIDVRGTLLHPYSDIPIGAQLVNVIIRLIKQGVLICLNTAGSLDGTLERLLLPRLWDRLASNYNATLGVPKIYAYVDSSTKGYALSPMNNYKKLDGYPHLSFSEEELKTVLKAIKLVGKTRKLKNIKTKIKSGQVNFYCGGKWDKRLNYANELSNYIAIEGHRRIEVMVPSAKNTIDIAVCKKSRGVEDFLSRFDIKDDKVLFIGDSFQEGGPDLHMLDPVKNAMAFHVGKRPPPKGVYHVSPTGTRGSYYILKMLLKIQG